MSYLGIDLGTSALKLVLVDNAQAVLAEAAVPLTTQRPRPGWSEQHPEDWWTALAVGMKRLAIDASDAMRDLRAIGLSGQMHGAVLIDRAGAIIRPAILWNDGRSVEECADLQAEVPELPYIAGVPAMPGFTAPKLLWIARHEPGNFARIWKVLSPKDFLRLRLTGETVTEMSDAAGTLWLDEGRRDWSEAILVASGLDRSHMPRLAEGTDRAGLLLPSISREWSIGGPVVVAGGAGDAAAAGIGIGAVEPRDAFISLGTSGQFFVTDDRYLPQPETFLHAFAHALPNRWFRMAAMLNGASAVEWATSLLGAASIGDALDSTERAYRGPSRSLFLPYLAGERTPHNDPDARGVFFGIDGATGPSDLIQATLEGVAFSFLEGKSCLDAAGIRLGTVAAVGGGARSRFWMQLFAHVLGVTIVRYQGSDKGPAFGAARLARLAVTGEDVAAVCVKPEILDRLEPDAALHAAYVERFANFRNLYRALRPEFAQLGREGTAALSD